jgi:hypothetical protein
VHALVLELVESPRDRFQSMRSVAPEHLKVVLNWSEELLKQCPSAVSE